MNGARGRNGVVVVKDEGLEILLGRGSMWFSIFPFVLTVSCDELKLLDLGGFDGSVANELVDVTCVTTQIAPG